MAKITRRRFMTGLGAAIVGTGMYTYAIEPHRVSVVKRDLPIGFLPSDLDGKLLVQISDLHVGPTSSDYLLDCFAKVAALNPEVVVITGDYMTAHNMEHIGEVGRLLDQLVRAPLGVFGTLGNHDYGRGWGNTAIADALVPVVEETGVRVLRNQVADAAGLQIIGMDELWAGRFQPKEAFEKYDAKRAAIVLSHNPDTLDRRGWDNYKGWILSGHTHGGQCKCPFFRPPYLPVENPIYTSGEIDLGDGRRVYINRGLGYNRRVRFNARPEITAFTMRRA